MEVSVLDLLNKKNIISKSVNVSLNPKDLEELKELEEAGISLEDILNTCVENGVISKMNKELIALKKKKKISVKKESVDARY